YARRYDQALEVLKRVVALAPGFHLPHGSLGFVYAASGQPGEAITCLKTARSLARVPMWTAGLGQMYGLTGQKEEAQACLQELETFSTKMYVEPLLFASI